MQIKIPDLPYCPTCSSDLHTLTLLDIYRVGYRCENNHLFDAETRMIISQESADVHSVISPAHPDATDINIIKFWLTDNAARSKLNSQIAKILSKIHEAITTESPKKTEFPIFKFCPFCKLQLEQFDQDDCWVRGIKCTNDHKLYERGGGVNYHTDDGSFHLSSELSNESVMFFIDSWLKGNPALDTNLHPEIKGIFLRFREAIR